MKKLITMTEDGYFDALDLAFERGFQAGERRENFQQAKDEFRKLVQDMNKKREAP